MSAPGPDRTAQDEARVAATALAFRRRSNRIRLARRVLPIAIIALAGGTLSWIVLRTVMSDVERKTAVGREIVLENSRFLGQDAEGRGFMVAFRRAVRDPDTGRYRLEGPALRLNLGGRRVTSLTADGGVYVEDRNQVVIGPNVRISDGESGFVLTTPQAVVDTQTGVITGDKGVQGVGPLGTVRASAYAIYEQGERVVFSGSEQEKVRGVINPSGSTQ